VFGANASTHEFVADVDRMADAAGESHGLPALSVFVPMRADIADQLGLVHAISELVFDIVARNRVHATQIGTNRRIDAGLDEIALLDQHRDLREEGLLTVGPAPLFVARTVARYGIGTSSTSFPCSPSAPPAVGILVEVDRLPFVA
jgi:hypothetical protein